MDKSRNLIKSIKVHLRVQFRDLMAFEKRANIPHLVVDTYRLGNIQLIDLLDLFSKCTDLISSKKEENMLL